MHPHATPHADPLHAPDPTHGDTVDVPAGRLATAVRGTPEPLAADPVREDGRRTRDAPRVIRSVSADQSTRSMVLHAPEARIGPRRGFWWREPVCLGECGVLRIDRRGSPRTRQHAAPNEPGRRCDPIRGDECVGHGGCGPPTLYHAPPGGGDPTRPGSAGGRATLRHAPTRNGPGERISGPYSHATGAGKGIPLTETSGFLVPPPARGDTGQPPVRRGAEARRTQSRTRQTRPTPATPPGCRRES